METTQSFELTEKQKEARSILASDSRHCALGGGSRSGKTFLLVYAVIIRALKAPNSRHVVFRYRFNSLKASVVLDTLPKVIKLAFPGLWEQSKLDKTDWYLTLPNGSEIWFAGLDDKDRTEKILGMEFATIYFNECSQIPWTSVVTARTRLAQKTKLQLKFYYDFNPPNKRHWTYRLFVEGVDFESGDLLPDPENYNYFLINPTDNTDNIGEDYLDILKGLPEKARKRFLLGQFGDDDDNALWTDEILGKCRIMGRISDVVPDFVRVIVAVDPSGCSGHEDTRSDEIGITVNALGSDGKGYLLEDLSGRYKPSEWGKVVAAAYHRHKADRVIGESNFGGAMVQSVIETADASIPYSEVKASRGKVQRAEPIAALYEQQKIRHIGHFPEIEEQLLSFMTNGYQGLKSPDRADAAIWGFTHLFPAITKPVEESKEIYIPQAYAHFG